MKQPSKKPSAEPCNPSTLSVESWPIDKPIPYARNPRKISDEAVAAVAGSIKEFGFKSPIIVDAEGVIINGHTRLKAAMRLGMAEVPVVVASDLTPEQAKAYRLADNRVAEFTDWDKELLSLELDEIELDLDFALFDDLLDGMDDAEPETMDNGDPDEVPAEAHGEPVSQRGEVYELGPHRLMCGDSTSVEDWQALMGGEKAVLIHADPPYGMGKEKDGVENDNIYEEKLDQFQMQWWSAIRSFVTDNASAYIWGNAPDLWRLWYMGGLAKSERMEMRNEIVWNKKNIPGMKSNLMTQYPEASERCLFFQIGQQFIGNINSDDFPNQWEPLLSRLSQMAAAAGLTPSEVKRICGCGMYAHWFTRSQFTLIPAKHYSAIASEYPGAFKEPWDELKAEWEIVKGSGREVINGKLVGMRSYFNNGHDSMIDVWDFGRVIGDERHGHATPKPVAMMERCIISSSPEGGIVAEPFAGSGTTLIAAAKAGRVCRTMEITPRYCDVIRRRWTKFAQENGVEPGSGALE